MKFGIAGRLPDIINCAKFFGNRFRDLHSVGVKFCPSPLTQAVAVNTVLRYRAPVINELPFMKISEVEMVKIFGQVKNEYDFEYSELKSYISKLHTSITFHQLAFNYYSDKHFNHSFRNVSKYKELAVFHLNIRSLNCNSSRLIE